MTPRVGEVLCLGFRGLRVPAWLRGLADELGLGAAILFDRDLSRPGASRNVESPAQVRALCAELHALPGRPLVVVDQEGGSVRRLREERGFAPLPAARDFAALPEDERRTLAGRAFREMAALGIDLDLAPVVDLALHPESPGLGAVGRCYSADPAVVEANARLLARAARDAGVALCLKHWPGLGGARTDSHGEITDLTGRVPPEQLALFDALAPAIPGRAVLLSHGVERTWDPEWPVSVSPAAVGELRRRVGPDVLLVSDDLQMQGVRAFCDLEEACVRALAAGVDLLVVGNNLRDEVADCPALARALAAAVERDPALRARLEESAARVRARKQAAAARWSGG